MKRSNLFVIVFCLACCFSFSIFANNQKPVLNIVRFPLKVEHWATTKTAKVLVSVNAVVSGSGLDKIHSNINKNLLKLSDTTEWHITTFQRSKDSSGLERVFAMAEARFPENLLAHLRRAAKSISSPGETYKIIDIQFVPSQAEIQSVVGVLRNQIYRGVVKELQRLNTLYPEQRFVLHNITFSTMPRLQVMNRLMAVKVARANGAGSMAVSRKVIVNADVELASIVK